MVRILLIVLVLCALFVTQASAQEPRHAPVIVYTCGESCAWCRYIGWDGQWYAVPSGAQVTDNEVAYLVYGCIRYPSLCNNCWEMEFVY